MDQTNPLDVTRVIEVLRAPGRPTTRWGMLPAGDPMPIGGDGADAYFRSVGALPQGTPTYGGGQFNLTGDWRAR